MKIAFIYSDKKITTGAHYINDLIAKKLKKKRVRVKNFYPTVKLMDPPFNLRGLGNILFFYSLLEHRRQIMKYDIIQGTTYTPLPFLAFDKPVVSHFGSMTARFLSETPRSNTFTNGTRRIWQELRTKKIIKELNIRSRRPMRDIAEIECYVATRADAVIAASLSVKNDLIACGVDKNRIHVIHNAIEDYWFETGKPAIAKEAQLVCLSRLGGDVFTNKLKGLDRMVHIFRTFPKLPKTTFCMTNNEGLVEWLKTTIPNHHVVPNAKKHTLPPLLHALGGSILLIPSRYEGFSLSLIEGMSQGLIPICYPIGVAPEIIINGTNGFIVQSQREAIEVVKKMVANRTLRLKIANAAHHTSHSFRADLMLNQLMNMYKEVLKNKKKTPK